MWVYGPPELALEHAIEISGNREQMCFISSSELSLYITIVMGLGCGTEGETEMQSVTEKGEGVTGKGNEKQMERPVHNGFPTKKNSFSLIFSLKESLGKMTNNNN
jgi:hypothetical protein